METSKIRLSPKEYQIVVMVCSFALRNKDIGEQLGTTEQMVKNYLRHIFDKTGAEDRLALCVWYYNGGRERLTVYQKVTLIEVAAPVVTEPASHIVSAAEIARRQQQ